VDGVSTAEVIDLAVVRGAVSAARTLTLPEIDAEVALIRAELRRPLERLSLLREAGAHLTAFGPGVSWHEACLRWFGDLADLRLTGTQAAITEREHLIWSMREAGDSTRVIRDRLGVGARAVAEALSKRDPAPGKVTGADGVQRPARVTRLPEPEPAVTSSEELLLAELRRTGEAHRLRLAHALRWSEGRVGGALVRLRRKGLAAETGGRADGYALWGPL
jgi:hypothetical protein